MSRYTIQKKLVLTSLLLSLIVVGETHGQNQVQKATLKQFSETKAIQFQQEKQKAIELADSLGLPVFEKLDNGGAIELMRFENGKPIYAITHNAEGATLINTDKVYSGGSASLDLSGSGQTLGIWDVGTVRATHDEFVTGRVTLQDAASTNNHATRVGGTMIASGVDSDAKGMSPEASLDSYDWNSDQSEMASAGGSGLRLSVHPYGYITGWGQRSGNWYWYGDPEETEDYSFGFYDPTYAEPWDSIAYYAPNYLIVNSAGNQRGQIAPLTVRDEESYLVYDGDAEAFVT